MKTDWNLVRAMMQVAIDTCEQVETLGYREQDRGASVEVAGQRVSVFDILTSAWTAPENLRHQIIRERHDMGADLPYLPETARIVMNMAQACAELIGGQEAAPADAATRKMICWYSDHAVPRIQKALEAHRPTGTGSSD